jgi:hypothetical protein
MSKVFISYSHDSEDHAARVLHLAQQLRHDGLECGIDQFIQSGPREGWPRWMQRQIEEAQYVLVICACASILERSAGSVSSPSPAKRG